MTIPQAALDLMPEGSPFPRHWFMRFGVIYADPNWDFKNFSEAGEAKNPKAHYECQSTDDICRLPVPTICAPDCWLVLWATAPMIPDAMRVMAAWEFGFTTAGAWAKESKTGEHVAFGTGYVRRSAAEFYLIGKRGQPALLPGAASIRNLIWSPVREHSRKPDQMIFEIEASFPGPYVELFAVDHMADPPPGWQTWGKPHR